MDPHAEQTSSDEYEDEIADVIVQVESVLQEATALFQQPPRRIPSRIYVHRERETAAARLFEDYFSDNPRWGASPFRRRFRMRRELFMRIADTLAAREEFFQERCDALGRAGISTLQKCTMALRQLAYGGAPDMFDEYLHVAETTGRDSLKMFCRGIIDAFGYRYLRTPDTDDVQRLMQMHEREHGFPGMLGSIDCMHWEWKNCPVAWRGAYTSGHKGSHPTIILEAVADHNLWIWHAFFGVPGSNNDINVLNNSNIFNDILRGRAPTVRFIANGNQYNMGYYLADGIYPQWPTFVKTISCPTEPKRGLFAQKQESARKDVERAFGVLQSRFAIVKGPGRAWYKEVLSDIMYTCIILHNMIIEDEGDEAPNFVGENLNAASTSQASDNPARGAPTTFEQYSKRRASTRDAKVHNQLQADLIEEIWYRTQYA